MGKFQIPRVPGTTNKTIRFPNDLVERVEQQSPVTLAAYRARLEAKMREVLENTNLEFQNIFFNVFFSSGV